MPEKTAPSRNTVIAALRYDDSAATQALMERFAHALQAQGESVAGVVQVRVADAATGRPRIALRDLESGALYPISQDLGPGSTACNLDSSELALACAAIENAARRGVALLMISKFAKQEAARGGLCDGFRAAMRTKTPVVAGVSPHYLAEWADFAGHVAQFVEPTQEALEEWWARQRRGRSLD